MNGNGLGFLCSFWKKKMSVHANIRILVFNLAPPPPKLVPTITQNSRTHLCVWRDHLLEWPACLTRSPASADNQISCRTDGQEPHHGSCLQTRGGGSWSRSPGLQQNTACDPFGCCETAYSSRQPARPLRNSASALVQEEHGFCFETNGTAVKERCLRLAVVEGCWCMKSSAFASRVRTRLLRNTGHASVPVASLLNYCFHEAVIAMELCFLSLLQYTWSCCSGAMLQYSKNDCSWTLFNASA